MIRNFYVLVLFVLFLGLVQFGAHQVGASRTHADMDETITIEGIPDCSFGYGQCRKGCETDRIQSLAKRLDKESLQGHLDDCLDECNFLYGGCKSV